MHSVRPRLYFPNNDLTWRIHNWPTLKAGSCCGVMCCHNNTISQNKDTQKIDLSNCYHATIHHQNADAMGLASAHKRDIILLDVPPFWIFSMGWMPLKRALARPMASAFWWWITVMPKSLENHKKKQKVGLLYNLFCDDILKKIFTKRKNSLKRLLFNYTIMNFWNMYCGYVMLHFVSFDLM